MGLELILVGLLGGLLGLDRRAVAQMMLSNPLVAAALIGLWCGDPAMGARVGALTALLWIHELPVGASIPPNDTVIAVITAFLACMLARSGAPVQTVVVISLLWAIPFGLVAQRIDAMSRRFNVAVSRWVTQGSPEEQGRMLVRAQGVGLLTALTGDVLCIWLAGAGGMLLLPRLVGAFPLTVEKALSLVYFLLPLVGVAAGIATINRRRAWWAVIALFVLFNLLAPVVGT